MINGEYLVIKYVPDFPRWEPINIGIVLKGPDVVIAKFSQRAFERVKSADPFADLAGLGFLERYMEDILGSPESFEIFDNLPGEPSQKLVFSEPLFVDLGRGLPKDQDQVTQRLMRRMVEPLRPRRRFSTAAAVKVSLHRALEPLIRAGQIAGEHEVRGKTGFERSFDAYFQNGSQWGIKAIKLDYSRASDLKKTAEAEAFGFHDVGMGSTNQWKFLAVCQFPTKGYDDARTFAETTFGVVGAKVFDVDNELEESVVPLIKESLR